MTSPTPHNRLLAALAAPLLVLSAACEDADAPGDDEMQDMAPTVQFVNPRSPADGDGVAPFSGAVWVGNTFYVSGMLGLEGGQVPETAEQEARKSSVATLTSPDSSKSSMIPSLKVIVPARRPSFVQVLPGRMRAVSVSPARTGRW